MKRLFIGIIILLYFSFGYAQIGGILPTERMPDWSKAGLNRPFPIHYDSSMVFIQDYLQSGDGNFYDNAVVRALDDLENSDSYVIYFPEGDYLFQSNIQLRPGIVLKGSGSDKTHFLFILGGQNINCFEFSADAQNLRNITSPINAGDSVLTVDPSFQQEFAGIQYVLIRQGINDFTTKYDTTVSHEKGQILEVASVNGNTIYLTEPVRLDYSLTDPWGYELLAAPFIPIENAGIENLRVTRQDDPAPHSPTIFLFNYALNCWIIGVESTMGATKHVEIMNSKWIELRGNYFSYSFNLGGGSNGYGCSVGKSSTDCLIEDNIFKTLKHSMILSTGANGIVFGYNASYEKADSNWDEAALSIHGHYPYMNLFESNYAEYANADVVWGIGGPYNTFFRNYIYHPGYFFGTTHNQQIRIDPGNNFMNITANYANVSIHTPTYGHFLLTNDNREDMPDSLTHSEYSYYLTSRPDFIPQHITFPCFGPPLNSADDTLSNTIPSKERIALLKKTVNAPDIQPTTSVHEKIIEPLQFGLAQNYPNPFNPETTISFTLAENGRTTLTLYSITGERTAIILDEYQEAGNHSVHFNADGLPSGVYFYRLENGRSIAVRKMILLR